MEKHHDFTLFYNAVLSIDSPKLCKSFFEDICTIKELEAMAQRLDVASLLLDGKTFNEVVSQTGASTTTIARVNRCLNYGDGGYRAVLKKLNSKE